GEVATGEAYQHIFNRFARHLLGGMDGTHDGGLGLGEIGDDATFDALAQLVADTGHAHLTRRIGAGDETGDLRGADIEHRDATSAGLAEDFFIFTHISFVPVAAGFTSSGESLIKTLSGTRKSITLMSRS